MKLTTNIIGGLLGFVFIAASLAFFFGPPPPPVPEGTMTDFFNKAMMTTGYMAFVKVCELVGGVLVAIPRTRNIGLLFLGPIILNILAFSIFVDKTFSKMPVALVIMGVICFFALFLLWAGRKQFAGLLGTSSKP